MYTNGHLESDINIDYKNLPYRTRVDDSSGKNKDLYGKMYNASMDEDKNNFDFSHLFNWKNIGWNFYKFEPGKWLRPHQDHFYFYKKYYNLESDETIRRCNIFLEDWKPGHAFGIDDKIIIHWKKYDYYVWDSTVEHWGGNFGSEDRYTLQLTGQIKE